MNLLRITLILVLLAPAVTPAQDIKAFQFYTKDGKETTYETVVKAMSAADVAFFGELHNNSMSHWMELQILKSLQKAQPGLVTVGAEMFESDDQLIIDEYLSGLLPEKNLKAEAKLWPNHKTDYQPILSFCKEEKLKVIATNIPRRYANLIYKKGFEGVELLDNSTKKLIAPMPIEYDASLPGYKSMIGMMGAGHGTENLPKAQAAKDATMAHFICKNLPKNGVFLHYNGRYHSDNQEGIGWYVKKFNKKAKVVTLSTEEADNINEFPEKAKGIADFILVVPSDMTKTY